MKVIYFMLCLIASACFWLWSTRPTERERLSDAELREELSESEEPGQPPKLKTVMAQIVEENPEGVPAALSPEPPPELPTSFFEPRLLQVPSKDDPYVSASTNLIEEQLMQISPENLDAKIKAANQLFQVKEGGGGAADLAIKEILSLESTAVNAPQDVKKAYIDLLAKVYIYHQGPTLPPIELTQHVEGVIDPEFKKILQDRISANWPQK